MSLADHEIEEPDEARVWCMTHDVFYRSEKGCPHCEADEADRQHDERKERQ